MVNKAEYFTIDNCILPLLVCPTTNHPATRFGLYESEIVKYVAQPSRFLFSIPLLIEFLGVSVRVPIEDVRFKEAQQDLLSSVSVDDVRSKIPTITTLLKSHYEGMVTREKLERRASDCTIASHDLGKLVTQGMEHFFKRPQLDEEIQRYLIVNGLCVAVQPPFKRLAKGWAIVLFHDLLNLHHSDEYPLLRAVAGILTSHAFNPQSNLKVNALDLSPHGELHEGQYLDLVIRGFRDANGIRRKANVFTHEPLLRVQDRMVAVKYMLLAYIQFLRHDHKWTAEAVQKYEPNVGTAIVFNHMEPTISRIICDEELPTRSDA